MKNKQHKHHDTCNTQKVLNSFNCMVLATILGAKSFNRQNFQQYKANTKPGFRSECDTSDNVLNTCY